MAERIRGHAGQQLPSGASASSAACCCGPSGFLGQPLDWLLQVADMSLRLRPSLCFEHMPLSFSVEHWATCSHRQELKPYKEEAQTGAAFLGGRWQPRLHLAALPAPPVPFDLQGLGV